MKNYERIVEKQKETEKHKTCSFLRRSFSKKKKVKSSKNVTKMVLPNYYSASLLRREKQEARENTEEHSSLLEGPTKQGTEFVLKKTVTNESFFFSKNIAFLWRREITIKEKFKKNWVFIVEKRKNDSQKRVILFKTKFFVQKKLIRPKIQEMRKATKKAQTTIATKRKDKEQETCAPKRKRKTKQREQSEKCWKRRWKKRRWKKSMRKTKTRRENQEEKGRKTDEKGIHKRGVKKRKREKSFKMQKTRMKIFFQKERKTFLHTKRL